MLTPFTALRAVEDDPGRKVFGQLLEAVLHSRRDEQNVSRPEGVVLSGAREGAAASRHHVQLVPGMRGLLVFSMRGVELEEHTAVGQERHRALTFGKGKLLGSCHRSPPSLVRLRSNARLVARSVPADLFPFPHGRLPCRRISFFGSSSSWANKQQRVNTSQPSWLRLANDVGCAWLEPGRGPRQSAPERNFSLPSRRRARHT